MPFDLQYLLFCNAFASFVAFIYFHATLILRIRKDTSMLSTNGHSPEFLGKLVAFLSGRLHADLRSKWMISVLWVVTSYTLLFVLAA